MSVLNFKSEQAKHSQKENVSLFRSEVRSLVVGESTLAASDLTGPHPDEVKVSEFRLEQYLNACSPTCHG